MLKTNTNYSLQKLIIFNFKISIKYAIFILLVFEW